MSHYLDYAATSATRPRVVAEAMSGFLLDVGASPGRGGYGAAIRAGRHALACRKAVQGVLGLSGDPGRVAFFQNATQALNTALWGTLGAGDVLVVSQYDHNAVLRPAAYLARTRGVEVRVISGTPEGTVDLDEAARLLEGAKMLVVNSASNVLGNLLPLRELSGLAREAGALVLFDAAQAAGHVALSCEADGVDLAAFTGHKGLLGPQGIGGLWVREGVEVEPILRGGTGGDSEQREMPVAMPDRLEAGTVNAPGIVGLEAGIDYLLRRGLDSIAEHEARLKARLRTGLAAIRGVRVRSPAGPDGVAIVTITADTVDASTLATRLDREWDVQVRSGLHCAPEAHRILGTLETGATRLSVGWASTDDDVDRALEGVEAIVRPQAVATS